MSAIRMPHLNKSVKSKAITTLPTLLPKKAPNNRSFENGF